MSTPIYLDWDSFGVAGIAGKSGSGKSSTVKFLIAQFALIGAGIVVADGHGHLSGENLVATIAPLKRCIISTAIEPKDILEQVKKLEQTMQYRLEHGGMYPKLVFVFDEFASIMLRFKQDDANEIIRPLLRLANEARKTNIRAFLLSQNWSRDYVGAAAIRSSLGATFIHNISENEQRLFFPSLASRDRKMINALRQGELVLFSQVADPIKVHVPLITQGDLQAIADRIPVMERDPSNAFTVARDNTLAQFIQYARDNKGKPKVSIITSYFKINPRSEKFQIAMKLLKALEEKGIV